MSGRGEDQGEAEISMCWTFGNFICYIYYILRIFGAVLEFDLAAD